MVNLSSFSNSIDFYYFSSTGNTLLIVKAMAEEFNKNGFNVNLFHLETSDEKKINLSNNIGLAFPIAASGTYPFIWEFIENMPNTANTPIFIIDTKLMYSGGIVGPTKKILEKKGYIPIGAKEFFMPSNVFIRKGITERKKRKINRACLKAKRFTKKLISGSAKWWDIPVYSYLLSKMSRNKKIWKIYYSLTPLRINKAKCSRCGICVKLCPVHNIEIDEFPEYKNKCCLCIRCFSYCPNEAIRLLNYPFSRYRAVPVSEILSK